MRIDIFHESNVALYKLVRKVVRRNVGFGKGGKDRLCSVTVTTNEDDMCVAFGVVSPPCHDVSLMFHRQL